MLLSFVPESSFRLVSGQEALTEYRFNKKKIAHLFCNVCGVQSFGKGDGPEGAMVAVNVRALDGIDLSTLIKNEFNGKDF